MKRFFALAALVLGLAACQTEPEGLNVNVDGEQLVTVNVTVPEADTRAGGDNSALGPAKYAATSITMANSKPAHKTWNLSHLFDNLGTRAETVMTDRAPPPAISVAIFS